MAEKLKHRATLHAKLVDEFEKHNRNLNRFEMTWNSIALFQTNGISFILVFLCPIRNSYTSRILEIIGNIRKQKASIDKVLNDTRDIQKEINSINGQLDRQFTVTDDLLFKVKSNLTHLFFLQQYISFSFMFFFLYFRPPKRMNHQKRPINYWLHYIPIVVI